MSRRALSRRSALTRSDIFMMAGAAAVGVGALYLLFSYLCKPSGPSPQPDPLADGAPELSASSLQALRQDTSRSWPWSKSKKVLTISAKNVLLWNPSPDPSQPNFAFRESCIPFLQNMLQHGRWLIHIIVVVSSDKEEEQIKALFEASGLYEAGLDPKRVLFCESEMGKSHIVRHINPACHVDGSDQVIEYLATVLPQVIRIDPQSRLEAAALAAVAPAASKDADLITPDSALAHPGAGRPSSAALEKPLSRMSSLRKSTSLMALKNPPRASPPSPTILSPLDTMPSPEALPDVSAPPGLARRSSSGLSASALSRLGVKTFSSISLIDIE
ncbi:uncharacterized protein BJ171DRAFT_72956 [Polychytrium aggregatum]|uniref:uncharacterized protein n=1 Tax=Polychytrium aggregatum TaxID=110093 RepID=UPI0022FF0ECE|nr:uncharacterized protein BJ171DRAFT_72956 [Polychytrium aggregatum]KAI9205391.1 hypothetical protein BJ171DRAFT_72956 [Polychytrium aggregatum]